MSNFYITKQGDTWDLISYLKLGSEAFIAELISANPNYKDIVILPAELKITLPDITTEELNNAQADLSPWRRWE